MKVAVELKGKITYDTLYSCHKREDLTEAIVQYFTSLVTKNSFIMIVYSFSFMDGG